MQNVSSAEFNVGAKGKSSRMSGGSTVVRSAILSLICIILSLPFPMLLSRHELLAVLSVPISILAGALFVYNLRKLSSIMILALAYVFAVSYTGSVELLMLVLSMLALCGAYSSLVSETAGYVKLLIVVSSPILSCGAAFAVTGDVIISLLPLALYLPSAAMGIAARCKVSRVVAISAFAGVSAIEIAAAALLHIYLQNGALSPALIRSSADHLQAQAVYVLQSAVTTAGNVPLSEDIISQIELLSEEMINCLLGLVSVLLLTVGYFVQKLQHSFFEKAGLEELQNKSGEPIRASVMSALVFLTAHICSFTSGASNNGSIFSSVAMNISLILLPLMLSVGGGFLFSLPHKLGFLAIVIWIGTVMLSAMLSSSLISVLALIGSFYTIVVSVDAWAKEHYSKGEDQ